MDTKGVMKELGAYTYEWNGEQNKIQLVEMEQADGWQVHKYRILVNGKKVVWNLEYIDNMGNITNTCDDKDKMLNLFGKMVEVWEGTENFSAPDWIPNKQKFLFSSQAVAKTWVDYIEGRRVAKPIIMPYVVAYLHRVA